MEKRTLLPLRRSPRATGRRRRAGLTLVEMIISLALLVVSGIAAVYSFMLLNRYAARQRYASEAKALCQERIEQATTMLFTPPGTLPSVKGQDGNYYNILGTSGYYTAAGVYTGAESASEPVTIYTSQDGTSPNITGLRITSVQPAAMTDSSGSGVTLPMVAFSVSVQYTVNGESQTYSMYTMRASN